MSGNNNPSFSSFNNNNNKLNVSKGARSSPFEKPYSKAVIQDIGVDPFKNLSKAI